MQSHLVKSFSTSKMTLSRKQQNVNQVPNLSGVNVPDTVCQIDF